MTESLDNILSGREAAPAQESAVEQPVTQAAPEGESQQAQPSEAEGESAPSGQKMVPHEALHAEKQKVKRYTEEVTEFRKANETLSRQVSELLQRVPVPKVEQAVPQVPDFYENPEAASEYHTRRVVSPELERIQHAVYANARLVAENLHGKEAAEEAIAAFDQAKGEGKIDPRDIQRVMNSGNPFHEAFKWHQARKAEAEIGGDPAAFRARVEAETEAKILAKYGLTPETVPAGGDAKPPADAKPVVMPSNLATARNVGARSGPTFSGPTPLADIFKR